MFIRLVPARLYEWGKFYQLRKRQKCLKMFFREADINDIPQIQVVRHSVKENRLSDPGLVTDRDCAEYISNRGKGWVCEAEDQVVGFAIADLKNNNIWALFVKPDFEKQGIGRMLHGIMLDWYFSQTRLKLWLGTAAHTRADFFYRKAGWNETGMDDKGEIKFEMTYEKWMVIRKAIRSYKKIGIGYKLPEL